MIRTVSDDRTRVSTRARAQSRARTCQYQAISMKCEVIASAHIHAGPDCNGWQSQLSTQLT